MEDTNEIIYPIVFHGDKQSVLFREPWGRATYGIEAPDGNRIILHKKFIDDVNNGKFKLQAFDSCGNDYIVVNIKRGRMNFSILDILFFSVHYYVDFEFKKVAEYSFPEFKEYILSTLKMEAKKWKKEGHDNYSNSCKIGKIVRATSIREIVEILLGKHWKKH